MTAKRIFSAIWVLLLSGALGISSALADTLDIKGDAPQTYTVVKGDTLWDISGRYLEKPWRWPELWEGNPQIANPHLIYPGDVISLSYVDGQPRLGINRARPNVKLSPKIHSTPISDAIPVVPVDALRPLLTKLDILDKASMEKAPYIIGGQENRILMGQGDRFYATGLSGSGNKQYQVYHLGAPIKDPKTNEIIAHEGIFVGDATLDIEGDPSTLLLTSSKREVALGDRLVAARKEQSLANFYPKVPGKELNGHVLNVIGGTGVAGRFQTVVINLGKTDGLSSGHVLSVFNVGETVENRATKERDDTIDLPSVRAATLLVIDTYEKLSYALVMESRLPIRMLDEVRTPE